MVALISGGCSRLYPRGHSAVGLWLGTGPKRLLAPLKRLNPRRFACIDSVCSLRGLFCPSLFLWVLRAPAASRSEVLASSRVLTKLGICPVGPAAPEADSACFCTRE